MSQLNNNINSLPLSFRDLNFQMLMQKTSNPSLMRGLLLSSDKETEA